MVARYLQKLSHLTPSDRRDNFCKYRATMKFLAPFLKEMDFIKIAKLYVISKLIWDSILIGNPPKKAGDFLKKYSFVFCSK